MLPISATLTAGIGRPRLEKNETAAVFIALGRRSISDRHSTVTRRYDLHLIAPPILRRRILAHARVLTRLGLL